MKYWIHAVCPVVLLSTLFLESEQRRTIELPRTEVEINEGVGVNEADGLPLLEGDIVSWDSSRTRRSLMRDRDLTWPSGVIPFEISPRLGWNARKVVMQAIEHWQNQTCLRFKSRIYERDYVLFVKEIGCWSHVGRVGGMQKLSVGRECERMGIVAHEIGHAVAFWHEHSRPDRNKYIKVLKKNVKPDRLTAFKRMSKSRINSLSVPYDFASIMHYDENAFSRNSKATIQLRGQWKGMTLKLGQRHGLSPLDVIQAKRLYKCDGWKPEEEKKSMKRTKTTFVSNSITNIKTNNH